MPSNSFLSVFEWILERTMLMLGSSGRDRLKLMLKISSSDWLITDFSKGFLGAAHQTIYMTGWVLLHWICLNGLSFLDLTFFVLRFQFLMININLSSYLCLNVHEKIVPYEKWTVPDDKKIPKVLGFSIFSLEIHI